MIILLIFNVVECDVGEECEVKECSACLFIQTCWELNGVYK